MGEKPKRLTVDDLHRIVRTFPEEIQNADGGRTVVLAQSIIAHFFGRDWFTAHIRPDAPKPGFLNYDFSSDQRREATSFRVVELAESLFNLQNIPGFDDTIAQMKGGGDKIEATCAELDFGRFLYIHDVAFRFNVPSMKKGADYDVELIYRDGLAVPADAKCKLESTDIDPRSISKTLEKGRKQLPADRPGAIFLKVPQSWVADTAIAAEMVSEGQRFFRNTDRSISVKFYVSHLMIGDGMIMHRHAVREITNERSKFNDGRNWDLFTDHPVPSSWNGMPPKWQRLFFFPKSQ
jgi:hypothetical protein